MVVLLFITDVSICGQIKDIAMSKRGRAQAYTRSWCSRAIGFEHVENLLVNLGKLDWLRSNGDATNSQLLDHIWKRIDQDTQHTDLLSACKSVGLRRAAQRTRKSSDFGNPFRMLPAIFFVSFGP